ncbi:hypothetical protein JG688_00014208 [Phytophthora aleatoria]|uniref:Jacalin-type lectin domain-containing protein n=1 Tax=Phytophthora aleatoria TaxID=2496075 RepID=A0A8J5I7Q9_9STRA|nr:hypothetical protein JG688_00014208 [Phytophthora aleatoria]
MALYLKTAGAINIDFSTSSESESDDSASSGDGSEDVVAPPAYTETPDISEPSELPPARASESASKEDESFFSFTIVPDVTLNIPTSGTVPPNWVGPSIGDFADTACYRKTHKQNSLGGCPQGYHANKHRCWAQCPISYPVQCLAECIPQNDDCILEIMSKVTNPGYVVLNIATAGVFNAIYKSFKMVKTGLMCAFNIFNIAEGISRFMRFRQIMTPNGTKEELLAAVYQTDLFLVDLPVAITACMGYPVPRYAYFADAIVTAAETFVKQLMINHNLIMSSADTFMRFFRNTTLGNSTRDLDAECATNFTTMDPSGIAFMMYNYVQSVCGPTEFIGEIDDGSATDALGLTTKDDAFRGSEGTWTKKGDGKVVLTFVSTDNKDVDVIIHSGGKKFASVKVCSGQTVIWTSMVKQLQEKTMYLDRWRPGFLGLPGSGGGSLLLWVPRSSEGGHLEMNVKINKS